MASPSETRHGPAQAMKDDVRKQLWELEKDLGDDLDQGWDELAGDWSSVPRVEEAKPAISATISTPPSDSSPASVKSQRSGGLGGTLLSALRFSWRSAAPPVVEADEDDDDNEVTAQVYSVDALERLLLWEDPWATGRVLSIGMYLLISAHYVVAGTLPLQLTSVLGMLALSTLSYNMAKRVWTSGGLVRAATGAEATPSSSAKVGQQLPPQIDEAALQRQVTSSLHAMAERTGPYIASAMALGFRVLSVRGHMGSSVWTAIALWLFVVLGELRVLSQGGAWLALWLASFSLPWLYCQCKLALDGVVDEAAGAACLVLRAGNRATLAGAAAASLVLFSAMGGVAVYLRLPLSLVAGAAVLAWRVHSGALGKRV